MSLIRRVRRTLAVVSMLMLASVASLSTEPVASHAVTGESFTNPIVPTPNSGDPWLGFHDGWYYYAATTWSSDLVMRKSRTLGGLKSAPEQVVFQLGPGPGCCSMWAPELQLLDGPNGVRWYFYFSADPSPGYGARQTGVLESAGNDPMGPYTYRGILGLQPNGGWAIDGSVLKLNGSNYFMYSAFAADGLQSNFIAKMTNPWTVQSHGRRISAPTLAWERQDGNVNEGMHALQRNGRTFITYSASACWGPNYKIGMLEYRGGDPLAEASWYKHPQPIFARNDASGVYGPGHHSFFTSPDGSETWIAYHANSSASDGCHTTRSTRAQKISWNADGTPHLGTPVATGVSLAGPSGEDGVTNGQQLRNRHSGLCLDDYNYATHPGAEVRQWTCTGAAVQDWYLDSAHEGRFMIKNRHSGLCLDNYNFATAPGAEIRQWTCNANAAQQWELSAPSNGFSTIRNRHSGLCLDNFNFATSPGAEVRLWTCNGSTAQQWAVG